jgi:two-component system sensor histidine kinase DesK
VTATPTLGDVQTRTGLAAFWPDAAARLRDPGARRWYLGSLWGLFYLLIPVVIVWIDGIPFSEGVLFTALIVVVGVVYVILPPLLWNRPWPVALAVLVIYLGLVSLAFPFIGLNAIWLWIYLPLIAAMSQLPTVFVITVIGVIGAGQITLLTATNSWADYWYSVALTLSVSVMMFSFSQQIRTVQRLRNAQGEIARLAVVEERERFARDMHDVLGHSLTVVTVKSQLARRLVTQDPERAERELDDIEQLTRAALTDLRASVAGYRAMSLATELAAANAALTAADIVPHLPSSADVVEPRLRETFAWVLRESVTNVVRHSHARNCWVAVERHTISVADDGRGLSAGVPIGHGLDGLRERAAMVGADLTTTPTEGGGTLVTVRAPASTMRNGAKA